MAGYDGNNNAATQPNRANGGSWRLRKATPCGCTSTAAQIQRHLREDGAGVQPSRKRTAKRSRPTDTSSLDESVVWSDEGAAIEHPSDHGDIVGKHNPRSNLGNSSLYPHSNIPPTPTHVMSQPSTSASSPVDASDSGGVAAEAVCTTNPRTTQKGKSTPTYDAGATSRPHDAATAVHGPGNASTCSTLHLGHSLRAPSLAFGGPSGASSSSTDSYGDGRARTAVGPEPAHASTQQNQPTRAFMSPRIATGREDGLFNDELVSQRRQLSVDVTCSRFSSIGAVLGADESGKSPEPTVLGADGAFDCDAAGSVGGSHYASPASSSSASPLADGGNRGATASAASVSAPLRSAGGGGAPRSTGALHASSNDVRVSADTIVQHAEGSDAAAGNDDSESDFSGMDSDIECATEEIDHSAGEGDLNPTCSQHVPVLTHNWLWQSMCAITAGVGPADGAACRVGHQRTGGLSSSSSACRFSNPTSKKRPLLRPPSGSTANQAAGCGAEVGEGDLRGENGDVDPAPAGTTDARQARSLPGASSKPRRPPHSQSEPPFVTASTNKHVEAFCRAQKQALERLHQANTERLQSDHTIHEERGSCDGRRVQLDRTGAPAVCLASLSRLRSPPPLPASLSHDAVDGSVVGGVDADAGATRADCEVSSSHVSPTTASAAAAAAGAATSAGAGADADAGASLAEKRPSTAPAGGIGSGRTFEEALSDVAGVAAHDESGAGMAPVDLAFAAASAKAFPEEYTKVLQELVDELGSARTRRIRSAETDAAIMLEMAALIYTNASVDQVRQRKAAYVYNYSRAATDDKREYHDEARSASSTSHVVVGPTAATVLEVDASAAASNPTADDGAAVTTMKEHVAAIPAAVAGVAAPAEGSSNLSGSASRLANDASTSHAEVARPAGNAGHPDKRKGKGKARAIPLSYTTPASRIATAGTSVAAAASTGAGVSASDDHGRPSSTPARVMGPTGTFMEALDQCAEAAIGDGTTKGLVPNVNISAATSKSAASGDDGGGDDAGSLAEVSPGAAGAPDYMASESSPLDLARATAVLTEIGCIVNYRRVIDEFVDQLKYAVAAAHVLPQAHADAIMLELGVLIRHGASAGEVAKRKDEWLTERGVPIADGASSCREPQQWEEDQDGEGRGGEAREEPAEGAEGGAIMQQEWGGELRGGEQVTEFNVQNRDDSAKQVEFYVIQEASPWRHPQGPYVVLMVPGGKADSAFIATEFATMRLIVLLGVEDAHDAVCDLLRLCPMHLDGWGPRPCVSVDAIPAPFNGQQLGPFGGAGLIRGDLIMDINGTHVVNPRCKRTWTRDGEKAEPWLRITFLRATGQTNNSTTSMVSSVVQRERIMRRLIARQRQALALEVEEESEESDPGGQRRMEEAEAALVYEGYNETVSCLVKLLGDKCEDGVYKSTVRAKTLQVKMKTFVPNLNKRARKS